MAMVNIKSEKLTPFGIIFQKRELFYRHVGSVINKELGNLCTKTALQTVFCQQIIPQERHKTI